MNSETIQINPVESKIYLIRGYKVMLDHDLAELSLPRKQIIGLSPDQK